MENIFSFLSHFEDVPSYLSFIFQSARARIRTCRACHSLWPTRSIICGSCLEDLQSYRCSGFALIPRPGKHFKNLSVYRWSPGESDLLSSLIYWLKNKEEPALWVPFCQSLRRDLRILLGTRAQGMKVILVPAPSNSGRPNHALGFAKALYKQLCRELDVELWDILQMEENSLENKHLDRRFRVRRMRALGDVKELRNSKTKVIFIDDVCTTGSTLEAAYLALKKPAIFYTVTLVSRTLA